MSPSFSHPCGRQLNRLAYPQVRHAATKASGHDGVNVLVSRTRVVLKQGGGLHDLSWLAVTALRNLQFEPSNLQRMFPFGIKPLDVVTSAPPTAPTAGVQEP